MSHLEYCICCLDKADLVSVHEKLSLEGYLCTHNNAAALVEQCFNIKIITCEVAYAMCSTCVSKVVQSCVLREQLVHNINSATDNKGTLYIKNDYENLVKPFEFGDSEIKDEYAADIKAESIHEYEDNFNTDGSSDDAIFLVDERTRKPMKRVVENNLDRGRKKCSRSINKNNLQGLLTKNKQLLKENKKDSIGVKVNVEIKNYYEEFFTETPLETSESSDVNRVSSLKSGKDVFEKKKNDRNRRRKTMREILEDEFEFLHTNCKDFGLFSWYRSKYKCLVCNEVFSNKSDFKTHTLKHESEDFKNLIPNGEHGLKVDISAMKCRHCDECVRDLDTFRSHLSLAHHIQADDMFTKISMFNLTDPKVKCGVCNKDFVTMLTLNIHMNEHSTNFICPHCGKCFITSHRLRGHMSKLHVSGTFKCNRCDKTFESLRKKNSHVKNDHGTRRFPCPHCHETFKSPGDKLRHLAESHDEELRKYKCENCRATYMTAKDLNKHISNVHLQVRNHPCTICRSSFFDAGTLKEHMVIHTGERTFLCQICQKKFARRGNLSQHMRVHRKKSAFVIS